jgi:acetamidase/formamidase
MIELIIEQTALRPLDAYALCSICVDLEITQAVNGTVGVHARLDKALIR